MSKTRSNRDCGPAGDLLDEFMLGAAPGHLLRLCQQRAVELFAEEVGEDGPTPRQFAILLGVHQNPGLNQTDLVRLTGIDRSTLAEILIRLVEREILRRERGERDQRTNALHLTGAGEALLRRTLPAVRRAQDRIIAPVPADRRDEIFSLLKLLAGHSETECAAPIDPSTAD